jgi:hypothetical protein
LLLAARYFPTAPSYLEYALTRKLKNLLFLKMFPTVGLLRQYLMFSKQNCEYGYPQLSRNVLAPNKAIA